MSAMASDHAQALIREEEKGYNKGVRDATAEHANIIGLCSLTLYLVVCGVDSPGDAMAAHEACLGFATQSK